jgi:hypothetical protein
MKDQLLFGAAKNCITPDTKYFNHLFDLGKTKFSSVQDELFVRCMYFENKDNKALLVSFDLDKAPYSVEWVDELVVLSGVPKVNILYIGIHAHTVPVTGFRPFEPYHDVLKEPREVQQTFRKYEAFVKERLFKTVKEAQETKTPVKIGFGVSECYMNMNRICGFTGKDKDGSPLKICCEMLNGRRPVNHNVYVVKIESLDKKPLGFFVNYAIHGTVMFKCETEDGTTVVSGDIGGNVSHGIEQEYPGAVAIWSSGAAGDVNPVLRSDFSFFDQGGGDIKRGNTKSIKTSKVFLDCITGYHLAAIRTALEGMDYMSDNSVIGAAEDFSLTPSRREGDTPYKIRLHLIRIGEVAIMGVNGELYTSHGLKIQEASPMKNTIVVNHDSSLVLDNPAYIYDDETIAWWENAGKCTIPGRTDFRGTAGTIEESLVKAAKRLFEQIL